MRRWSYFLYGVFCHLLFLATYAAMAGFFADHVLLPVSINSLSPGGVADLAWDLGLIALFAVQHSIMARPWFKVAWTKFVPQPIERSSYVLASCAAVILLMWNWRGLGTVLWDVRAPFWRAVVWTHFAAGWLMVPAVSLMINHFDLFGTRQVWLYLRGRPYAPLPFQAPLLYRFIRHPLYVGWALAFWAAPTMTAGHLLLAGTLTCYMAVAAKFEERDLVSHFGEEYRNYQASVGAVIPRFNGRRSSHSKDVSAFLHEPKLMQRGPS
jgi:protein-S-isoprenylcysteine O-methyltransferase Ste14